MPELVENHQSDSDQLLFKILRCPRGIEALVEGRTDLGRIGRREGGSLPREPILPEGLRRDNLARAYLVEEWNAHWTRAMENILDSPHLPFVHRRTIGRAMRAQLKPDSKMHVVWEDTDFGGRTQS